MTEQMESTELLLRRYAVAMRRAKRVAGRIVEDVRSVRESRAMSDGATKTSCGNYFTAPGNRTSFSNEAIARSASSSP